MNNCIFCKIANNEAPSFKVYEDKDFLAFLDINPNTKGMTVIIPKRHLSSYIFSHDQKIINSIIKTAKRVSKKIEKGLNIHKVACVFEGMGVNHLHAKLYPMHGVGKEFKVIEHTTDKVYFDKYPGYITTEMGEQADFTDLKKTAEKIRES